MILNPNFFELFVSALLQVYVRILFSFQFFFLLFLSVGGEILLRPHIMYKMGNIDIFRTGMSV